MNKEKTTSLEKIINKIEEKTSINISKDFSRNREIVDAKKIYSKIALENTIYGCVEIGRRINLHHSSILHHHKVCNELIETNKEFRDKFNAIFSELEDLNVEEDLMTQYLYHKRKYESLKRELEGNGFNLYNKKNKR